MGPAFGVARERIGPRVDAARDAVGPRARTVITAARDKVRDDVFPLMTQTVTDEVRPRVARAWTASEPTRDEAKARGTLAMAALRGELSTPELPTGRRRGLLVALLAVLAAVGGGLFWRSQSRREAWLLADVEDEDSGASASDASASDARWNAAGRLSDDHQHDAVQHDSHQSDAQRGDGHRDNGEHA